MEAILLAERMGWTLDYIENMDIYQRSRIVTILDAWDKARTYLSSRRK